MKCDNKDLLVKGSPDGKDVYNLPAGRVDKNQQLKVIAPREAREETGHDTRLIQNP